MVRPMIERSRVRITLAPLGNFGNFFTTLCWCLSEQTLKAVGLFYQVSMPGRGKYSTPRASVQTIMDSIFYLVKKCLFDADLKECKGKYHTDICIKQWIRLFQIIVIVSNVGNEFCIIKMDTTIAANNS